MGIFRRRHDDGDVVTRDDRDDVVRNDDAIRRDDVLRREEIRRERKDVRGWGSPPLVRAIFTLLGIGAAGFLIWLASLLALEETGEFWAAMGLIAGAGLALGLSQLFGGWTKWGLPTVSPGVFLLAFVPTAIVVGWILLATQPQGGWQQERLAGWSEDIGIGGLVSDLGLFPAALALGLGLVFAFTFDTTGPRERRIVERDTDVVPDEDVHHYTDDVERPVAGERTVVRDDRTAVGSTREPSTERVEIHRPERH